MISTGDSHDTHLVAGAEACPADAPDVDAIDVGAEPVHTPKKRVQWKRRSGHDWNDTTLLRPEGVAGPVLAAQEKLQPRNVSVVAAARRPVN
jgi:hypothetical protein